MYLHGLFRSLYILVLGMSQDLQWKLLPGNTHICHSGSDGMSVLFEWTAY